MPPARFLLNHRMSKLGMQRSCHQPSDLVANLPELKLSDARATRTIQTQYGFVMLLHGSGAAFAERRRAGIALLQAIYFALTAARTPH